MNLGEVIGRSRQEFVKLADRVLFTGAGEMSDQVLYCEFSPRQRNGSGEGTAGKALDRLRAGKGLFFPSLNERPKIVETMNRRYAVERDAILVAAEKALSGTFDLLGIGDLNFGTPIDWQRNPITGDRAPLIHWSEIDSVAPIGKGDLKVFWELHRHMHLVTLGQAYWLTGDHRYVKAFKEQVLSWIEENPVGVGIGWSASLDVSFRAIQWLWALHLCADSPEVTQEFVARFIKSLIEHGRHIEKYLSTYFSPNTHLTGEALGLFYLGLALPELRNAEKWQQLGLRVLLEQLPKHVREDGVYFEQSSYYHRYTADFYTHLFALISANAVQVKSVALEQDAQQMLQQKLTGLFDHLMWIARPEGSWPLFGDDDGGRLSKFAPRAGNDFRDTLAMGAALFRRGDWKQVAGDAPVEMLWLLGADALADYDKIKKMPAKNTSQAFNTSGYFVMRDGWERDSSFVLIDCGRHGSDAGPGHAHSDALAIELALSGTTWLVDPATFVYGADAKTRDWFRSTGAHNTAMVDGLDQSEMDAPFAWRTIANCEQIEFEDRDNLVKFKGAHDGYQRLSDPVTHTRSVVFLRKQLALTVTDQFAAQTRHTYSIRFHFTPDCDVEILGNCFEVEKPTGEVLTINVFAKGANLGDVDARVETGWVSTCYGQRTEAQVAVFEVSGEGQVEVTSVIFGCSAPGVRQL